MATVRVQSATGLDNTEVEIDGAVSVRRIREELGGRLGIGADYIAVVDNGQVTNTFEVPANGTVTFRPGQKARG